MRRRLEKYPHDFLAQYNLGALSQSKGQLTDAISAYQDALQADPASATAHNSLGAALLMQGRFVNAIEEFHESLRLDPGYGNAQDNLAEADAALGTIEFSEPRHTFRDGGRLAGRGARF
jgi:tetratricopeptide (TPR) repeat protein